MIITLAKVLLALGTIETAGWLATRYTSCLRLLERAALSFGLGLGIISLTFVVLSLINLPLTTYLTYGVSSFIWLVAFLNWMFTRRQAGNINNQAGDEKVKPAASLLTKILIGLLMLLILTASANIFIRGLSRPMASWDDRAVWTAKAKIIYYEQTVKGTGLTDTYRLHPHKNYPLLVSLSEFYIFSMLGKVRDRIVKILFVGIFACLAILLFYHVKYLLNTVYGLAAVLILLAMPVFSRLSVGFASGYADVPLAFYYSGGIMYAASWLRLNKSEYLYISGALLGMAVFTKNEGLGLALIALFLLVILSNSRRKKTESLLKAGALLALIAGLWLSLKQIYPRDWEDYAARLTLNNILTGTSRIKIITKSFARETLSTNNWGLLYPIALLSLALSPLSLIKRENLFIFLNIVFGLAMYTLTFMITPWNLEFLISVSLFRLLMPMAPIIIMFICYQIRYLLNFQARLVRQNPT